MKPTADGCNKRKFSTTSATSRRRHGDQPPGGGTDADAWSSVMMSVAPLILRIANMIRQPTDQRRCYGERLPVGARDTVWSSTNRLVESRRSIPVAGQPVADDISPRSVARATVISGAGRVSIRENSPRDSYRSRSLNAPRYALAHHHGRRLGYRVPRCDASSARITSTVSRLPMRGLK